MSVYSNYPTCNEKDECLYCGAARTSCWCGIRHVCLHCHQQFCKCERVANKILEVKKIIERHIAGNVVLCHDIAKEIVEKLNLVPS